MGSASCQQESVPGVGNIGSRSVRAIEKPATKIERTLTKYVRDAGLSREYAVRAHRSEPASPLEPNQRQNGTQQDHRKAAGVAPLPRQFRHELEIHAIDAG